MMSFSLTRDPYGRRPNATQSLKRGGQRMTATCYREPFPPVEYLVVKALQRGAPLMIALADVIAERRAWIEYGIARGIDGAQDELDRVNRRFLSQDEDPVIKEVCAMAVEA